MVQKNMHLKSPNIKFICAPERKRNNQKMIIISDCEIKKPRRFQLQIMRNYKIFENGNLGGGELVC